MKFKIKNRLTGDVQFTADIETDSNLASVKLGLAVKWGVKNGAVLSGADFRGANLRDTHLSDTDLRDTHLRGAHLGGAHLSGANLSGANLGGAHLGGAHLRNANLRGANLQHAKGIVFAQSGDYTMFLYHGKDGVMVKADCRDFTLSEAKRHWSENKNIWTHKTDEYGAKQLRLLAFLESELALMAGES